MLKVGWSSERRAERPVILSLFFLNRQIIDAGMACRHDAEVVLPR
jgi:hypothetical protein